MCQINKKNLLLSLLLLLSISLYAAISNVTVSPTVIKEGNDYASQNIQNPWDMDDIHDIHFQGGTYPKYSNLSNVAITANGLECDFIAPDPNFIVLYPGYSHPPVDIPDGYITGKKYPIDSSKYSTLSMKVYFSEVLHPAQGFVNFYFYYNDLLEAVSTKLIAVHQGWNYINIDLTDSSNMEVGAWSDHVQYTGLRVDLPPSSSANHAIIPYIRFVEPGSAMIQVDYTGEIEGQTKIYLDNDLSSANGISYDLESLVDVEQGQNRYNVDVSGVKPGDYNLFVVESFDYSTINRLNPWDCSGEDDFLYIINFDSYNFLAGCFYGVTDGVDGCLYFNVGTGKTIDASNYKYLTIDMDVQSGGTQSYMELFWESDLETSTCREGFLPVEEGRQQYRIDLSQNEAWHGNVSVLRLDPSSVSGSEVSIYSVLLTSRENLEVLEAEEYSYASSVLGAGWLLEPVKESLICDRFLSGYSIESGVFCGTTGTGDASISLPVSEQIPADAFIYRYLLLDMDLSSSDQSGIPQFAMQWKSDLSMLTYSISNVDLSWGRNQHVIDLFSLPGWRGNIESLTIVPCDQSNANVELFRISLVPLEFERTSYFSESLFINPIPVGQISSPAYDAGPDFAATHNAYAWDFDSSTNASDYISAAWESTYAIDGSGVLNATSDAPDGDSSITFKVDSGQTIDTSKYHYVSYRFKVEGEQDLAAGWGSRFVFWEDIPENSGHSYEVPIYEGWWTYSFDLNDAKLAVGRDYWSDYSNLTVFRFDPSEIFNESTWYLDYMKLCADIELNASQQAMIQYSVDDNEQSVTVIPCLSTDKSVSSVKYMLPSTSATADGSALQYSFTPDDYGVVPGNYFVILKVIDSSSNVNYLVSETPLVIHLGSTFSDVYELYR